LFELDCTFEDPDQSLVRGPKSERLSILWAGRMGNDPADPTHSHWVRLLWREDYSRTISTSRDGRVRCLDICWSTKSLASASAPLDMFFGGPEA